MNKRVGSSPTLGTIIQIDRFLAVFLFLILSYVFIRLIIATQGLKLFSTFPILLYSFVFIRLQPQILVITGYTLTRPEPLEMQAEEIKAIREGLNLSQSLFALKLRTSVRTYQGWEQGKSKPNQQAMLLLRMVQKDPKPFEKIANA